MTSQRCTFPFQWKGQTFDRCSPQEPPSADVSDCLQLDDFLKKSGNNSDGVVSEVRVVGSDGKEKKCFSTTAGQYGW